MVFAHDTEEALSAAAALVNTHGRAGDTLVTRADLDAFVVRWGWTGSRRDDDSELADVRALRPRLRRLWRTTPDEIVELVNAMLREARALPQLVTHDGHGWHIHATSAQTPLAERMAVEAAMAVVDVVRSDELARLQVCAASGCDDVLVDLSRNRSRRFCSISCANRTNVAAFRARRAPTGG
ncbi:MAG TPA: CGNR zinc finger domain-containing protein [Actinomycetales bacterium]|jgi:predicted RNA-binding Zn ribbon-like protein